MACASLLSILALSHSQHIPDENSSELQIPLAKKLETCGVFGVSSSEYLGYAEANREEWLKKGEELVQVYLERFKLRESIGSGALDFDESTPDFSSRDNPASGDRCMDGTNKSLSADESECRMANSSTVGLSMDADGHGFMEIEV